MGRYDHIEEVQKADRYDYIEEVRKFNQNHDSLGRFSSAGGGGGRAIRTPSTAAGSSFGGTAVGPFTAAVKSAKAERAKANPEAAWRVTDMSASEFETEHKGAVCHVTPGGSTCAVTTDGDIVSVCKKPGDTVSGKELIQMAVENGGKKLDSYDGNHGFYAKCGFEPRSWCKWDDAGADEGWISQDWLKANGLPANITTAELRKIPNSALKVPREDIIFYEHTGKPSPYRTAEDFKKAVSASSDYGAAQQARDSMIK